jgi:hypothetical protein
MVATMMRPADVRHHLQLLNLAPAEAATLLGVGLRTVRRWTAPGQQGEAEPVPGAVEAALRAWLKLHRLGLSWRPDASALAPIEAPVADAPEANARALHAVLERVRERRGPATQWDVDLARCRATLGKMTVSFYRLKGGGFTPQSFRRSDGATIDLARDQALLEDAYFCIAKKLALEGDEPAVHFALDEPEESMAWDNVIEMWDNSLSPAILVTIDCDGLRAAFEIAGADDEDLLRVVRAYKTEITQLAENRFVRGFFDDVRVDAQFAPVFRRITLGARELAPLAGHARPVQFAAALEKKGAA